MVVIRKKFIEIDSGGAVYYLLNAFIGAYNRRTDVMERAVKLDERIRGATEKLNAAGESLKQTVQNNQPDKENSK